MRTFCIEHLKTSLMHRQLLIQVPRKGKVAWAQLQQFTVHVLLRPNYVCHRSHKPGQGVRFVAVHPAKHQLQEKEKAKPLQWGLCRITISTVSFTLEFLGEVGKGWEGIQRLESDLEKELSSTGDKGEILKHRGKNENCKWRGRERNWKNFKRHRGVGKGRYSGRDAQQSRQ